MLAAASLLYQAYTITKNPERSRYFIVTDTSFCGPYHTTGVPMRSYANRTAQPHSWKIVRRKDSPLPPTTIFYIPSPSLQDHQCDAAM